MYGGAGQDRRKNQNNAKNYGRRRTDYEEKYNKMRQQRDNYANNQSNSNYQQNNQGYGNDSYFDAQNSRNETFQYTQYRNDDYGEFKNQYKDRNYNSSVNYNSDSNSKQYSEGLYNNYSQYGNTNYGGNNYQYGNTEYGNNNYNNTSYGNTSYGNSGYGNTGYDSGYNNLNNNDYSNYYTQTDSYTNINQNNNTSNNTNNNKNQYNTSYNSNYQQYNNDYSNTMYDSMQKNDSYGNNVKCDISVLQPAKSHPFMSIITGVLMIIFIGLASGQACRTIFKDFYNEHIASDNLFVFIIRFLGIIMIVLISYWLHIILHEFGHLIGGSLSGYTLISFRIFSIVLVKENKKTKIKKYSVVDTAGECVMMPPEIKKGKYPYILYRISGVAVNLITSIVALILALGVDAIGKYPWNMWCIIFAIDGIINALYNGIPLVFEGIPNDGYVLLHMIESNEARLAVHSQLLIYAFLSKGGSYSDVPYEQFCVNQTGEINNFLVIRVKLLEYKWHLEHLDFNQAAKCLEATNQFFNSLPRKYQYEINSEKLFIEIMCEHDRDIIDKLYNADVRKYIEESQYELSKNRLMMAYEAGVKNDMRGAHKYYMQLKNGAKTSPIKGEIELELMLADYVYERFCSGQNK